MKPHEIIEIVFKTVSTCFEIDWRLLKRKTNWDNYQAKAVCILAFDGILERELIYETMGFKMTGGNLRQWTQRIYHAKQSISDRPAYEAIARKLRHQIYNDIKQAA